MDCHSSTWTNVNKLCKETLFKSLRRMTCSRNHSIKKNTTEIPEFMTPNANLLTVQKASIPQQISIRDHSAITIEKNNPTTITQ